jgi:hypothetical protein
MITYIECNLHYYLRGNGKGSKKYSNTINIIFLSIIEYINFKKAEKIPYDELQLKRRKKRNKCR